MNKQTLYSVFGAASLLFGFVSSANAQVITFDGLGLNEDDPVTVDGFVFDYMDMDGWAIGLADGGDEYDLANEFDTGSEIITCRDTGDGECKIVMTESSGALFSLTSFDGADGLLDVGGRTIVVTGTMSDGRTVVDIYTTVASTFTTYSLPSNFSNLVSVEFWGFGRGDDMIAFDNINVTVVPVPAAAWLFGSGLLGLIGFARRNRA